MKATIAGDCLVKNVATRRSRVVDLCNSVTSLIQTPIDRRSVHISVVSLFRGLNCIRELFLGDRCPHFRSVLREGVILVV